MRSHIVNTFSSVFLDAQKGQPIEVEVILGEVVRMAKERHVNIPVGSMGAFSDTC